MTAKQKQTPRKKKNIQETVSLGRPSVRTVSFPGAGIAGSVPVSYRQEDGSRIPQPTLNFAQLSGAGAHHVHQTPAAGTTVPGKPCARGNSYHREGCERR